MPNARSVRPDRTVMLFSRRTGPVSYPSPTASRRARRSPNLLSESLEPRQLFAAVAPNDYEQLFIELTNRARANPTAEAARHGIDLNEGIAPGTISTAAKQPLAINPYVTDAARRHSQWMIDTDVFAHSGAGGSDPGERMESAGYAFTGSWTWGENLAWSGSTGSLDVTDIVHQLHRNLFVDEGIEGRGHRTNLMADGFREAGAGVVTGDFTGYNAVMGTMDFGRSGSNLFLTGVAYTDGVADDNFYTPGEGLGGVTVTATRAGDGAVFTTSTWSTGGYSLAVPAGTYTVVASGGSLGGNVRHENVVVSTQNVKRDFTPDLVSGDFATLADDGNLVVEGTAGGDEISVTASGGAYVVKRNGVTLTFAAGDVDSIQVFPGEGDDSVTIGAGVIGVYVSAAGGNDLLVGGEGNDSLTGGSGKDRIYGNGGDDRLNGAGGHDRVWGGNGKDRIYGGAGNDWVEGGAHLDRLWGEAGADSLFGQSGRDTFYARDGESDFLAGASDDDSAYADADDLLASIEALLA